MSAIVQLASSAMIAFLSLIISSVVSHDLNFSDRSDYGIYMVTIGQFFVLTQMGMPGALNVSGLYAIKSGKIRQILIEFLKRAGVFTLATVALFEIFELDSDTTIMILVGYLVSIPMQWIIGGFQTHMNNWEHAIWRLGPTFVQFIILLTFLRSRDTLELFSFVEIWLIANVVLFFMSAYRYSRLELGANENLESSNIKTVSKLGQSGFIAHIGLSDLIKFENYLIPLLKPVFYSANFFAVGGLANWPRILIDGLATAYLPEYKKMNLEDAKILAARRVSRIVLVCTILLLISKPFGEYLMNLLLGVRYRSGYDLFIILSLSTLFAGSRRLYLDAFRSHGGRSSIFASKLEFRSWLISLSSIFILLGPFSIYSWAAVSAFTNFVSLLYLIKGWRSPK